VAVAGLQFAPIRPDQSPGQQDPDFIDRLLHERETPAAVFRAMFLPSLRESLEDMLLATDGADGIVSHTLTPAARLAAEAKGVPWLSAVMQPMGYLSTHEPPVVALPWLAAILRRAGPGLTAVVLRAMRQLTQGWISEWHVVRDELGLPPVPEHPLWEGQHAPRRSLGLFPQLLGSPQPDWPPQARITGFPFYRAPGRALDPAAERFLADGHPPLVFTLGTTAVNDPGLFYAESAAAARLLGRRALLLGARGGGMQRGGRSDDVLAVPYAPHDLVFPRAAAIVHQGGIGTLSEALLAGKPMLIMPYGHDQADNAWRASRLGVSHTIPRRRYRAREVSRALARLLNDPGRGASAARAAHDIARERGASVAADMILASLSS
jgi:UDP:flavonoid glycosyltransferase YjiC (YdhE family)